MTHSYQFESNLPRSRKKLNARFVHHLKCLCGRKYHLYVSETFGDDEFGDSVCVCVPKDNTTIKGEIMSLCESFGIGSDYVEVYDDEFEANKEYVHIYLSRMKPYNDFAAAAKSIS